MYYIFFILLGSYLNADTIYIVANKNFPKNTLAKRDIKQIYLDKKRHIDGKKILALNYPHDSLLREKFEAVILKKSKKNLERYWLKAHYKGHQPPKVLKTKKSMLLFLQKIDTAIGYTDNNISQTGSLKVLLKVTTP